MVTRSLITTLARTEGTLGITQKLATDGTVALNNGHEGAEAHAVPKPSPDVTAVGTANCHQLNQTPAPDNHPSNMPGT